MSQSTIRIIPRLDIKGPNLVKGIQFDGYRVLGTPDAFAEIYYQEGADELIFYDVVASLYRRNSLLDVIKRTASKIFIPLTVAGGIRSLDQIREILRAGADKVAINTAATETPELIEKAAKTFGSQCIVSSIEAHRHKDGHYEVWVDYGRQPTAINALEWAERVVELGAGEILAVSIDKDGMGKGFDLELVSQISKRVPVPVIAGGGAGSKEDMLRVVQEGKADAVSAASLFHYYYARPVDQYWMSFNEPRLRMGEAIDSGNIDFLKSGYGGFNDIYVQPCGIPGVKQFLSEAGVAMRSDERREAICFSNQIASPLRGSQ